MLYNKGAQCMCEVSTAPLQCFVPSEHDGTPPGQPSIHKMRLWDKADRVDRVGIISKKRLRHTRGRRRAARIDGSLMCACGRTLSASPHDMSSDVSEP